MKNKTNWKAVAQSNAKKLMLLAENMESFLDDLPESITKEGLRILNQDLVMVSHDLKIGRYEE